MPTTPSGSFGPALDAWTTFACFSAIEADRPDRVSRVNEREGGGRDAILRPVNDRPGRGRFATTRWSLVLAAGADAPSPGARKPWRRCVKPTGTRSTAFFVAVGIRRRMPKI